MACLVKVAHSNRGLSVGLRLSESVSKSVEMVKKRSFVIEGEGGLCKINGDQITCFTPSAASRLGVSWENEVNSLQSTVPVYQGFKVNWFSKYFMESDFEFMIKHFDFEVDLLSELHLSNGTIALEGDSLLLCNSGLKVSFHIFIMALALYWLFYGPFL